MPEASADRNLVGNSSPQDFHERSYRRIANAGHASAELRGHASVRAQANVARRKPVPSSQFSSRELVKYVPLGKAPQGSRWRSIFRVACNPRFFSLDESPQVWAAWPESKLPIEPERARLNGFLVIVSKLIGIHRNASCTGEMAQA